MVVAQPAAALTPSLRAPSFARAVIALRATDHRAAQAARVLRSAERRLARAEGRVARAEAARQAVLAQVRGAAPAAMADIAGALIAASRERAQAIDAHDRLADVQAGAQLELRTALRGRATVLAGLALPMRARVLRAEARSRRLAAARRGRVALPAVLVPVRIAADAARAPVAGAAAVVPAGVGAVAAAYALTQVGVGYAYGGMSPATGFDCSGLVEWAFAQAGVEIPRSSGEIWAAGRRIPRAQAQPGDVVSFGGQGHVGIYLGDGLYVHSKQSGDIVRVERIDAFGAVDGFVRLG
mgnify:FL=1